MSLIYVDPLFEMLAHFQEILSIYRVESGVLLACQPFDFLPREILSSFGMEVVTPPAAVSRRCGKQAGLNFPPEFFDFHIQPSVLGRAGSTDGEPEPVLFDGFKGYGEDAAVELHGALERLISETVKKNLKNIDVSLLQKKAEAHNTMRRLVRGITSARRSAPELISYEELLTVFEAAMAFPPELVLDHLERLCAYLQDSTKEEKKETGNQYSCLIFSGAMTQSKTAETVEAAGVTVAEDDHCNGRRQFDLSVNAASEYLFYELLDALTYRPLCPVLRPPEERYELLYKLLRNHGIDLVIFLKDTCCHARLKEMEYLRVRLMRDGIDPLVTTEDAAADDVGRYLAKAAP